MNVPFFTVVASSVESSIETFAISRCSSIRPRYSDTGTSFDDEVSWIGIT